MTKEEVMQELEKMGSEQTRKIYTNHGARPGSMFGVKISDLKILQKKIKKDHQLSQELFATGNMDAQYLAGLIADEKKISAQELSNWAGMGNWYMISEYTVPWIAAESAHGWELAAQWIESDNEHIQSAGWSTYANLVALVPDDRLDLQLLQTLMQRVRKDIHQSANRVRYTMNAFLISVGGYVVPLQQEAMAAAKAIGAVQVNLGNTSCQVPAAPEYIQKMWDRGTPGKKKKQARC